MSSYGKLGVVTLLCCAVLCLKLCRVPWQNPLKVPIVSYQQIVAVTNTTMKTSFVCPPGNSFSLLVGMPNGSRSAPRGAAHITIKDPDRGQLELAISGTNLTSVNWLDSKGIEAYVIHTSSPIGPWELGGFLQELRKYSLMMEGLSPGITIWILRTSLIS